MGNKIGFIDSGVGGLSVLNIVAHHLDTPEIIYLADAAHLPYGTKTPAFLRERAQLMTRFLKAQGVSTIYVACHTLSATVLHFLKTDFPEITYIDLVPLTTKAACQSSVNKKIGIMATEATIKAGIHKKLLLEQIPTCTIIEQACPDFVPLVEQGQPEPATQQALENYLQNLLTTQVDTIILGCTHYPFLEDKLKKTAPAITFVSAASVLQSDSNSLTRPIINLVTTGTSDYITRAAQKFCTHSNCCTIKTISVGEFLIA